MSVIWVINNCVRLNGCFFCWKVLNPPPPVFSSSGDLTCSPNGMAVPLCLLPVSVITSPLWSSRPPAFPDRSTFTSPAPPTHRPSYFPHGHFTPPAPGSRKWRTAQLKVIRWRATSFPSPPKLWLVNLWVRGCWTSWSITTTASDCWELIRRSPDAWCGGCCTDNSSLAGRGDGYVQGNYHILRHRDGEQLWGGGGSSGERELVT